MADKAQTWDVIVIGAGMGGGIATRVLAEAGLRVLVLEKGRAGYRAERTSITANALDPVARSVRSLWPGQIKARIDGRDSAFFGPIGAGIGGSSVFYAATLERPERHDLDHSAERPHPTGGWPVSYGEMAPWYDRAEQMLQVCGDADPLSDNPCNNLRPAPEMAPGDAALAASLRAVGLNPYRSHSAIRYVAGCLDCLGHKCPKPCKMDGRSAGIEPAMETGRVAVLDQVDVAALRGKGGYITHIEAAVDGTKRKFEAKAVVLAAGALNTPRLLLASTQDWPTGAANSSDWVGRGLMFHLNEMFALWPRKSAGFAGPSKAISMRDLYWKDGLRFGVVQAMGIDAGYGEILHYLRNMLARTRLGKLRVVRELVRIPAMIAARLFGNAKVFVGILEDLPYPENRVTFDASDGDDIAIKYDLHPELRTRRRAFRKAIKRVIKGHKTMFLNRGAELNFGHPCGTCRMGNDPETSVVNAECRTHDLANCWIVDASVMPTSMGVNPSLTIAANAMRVATVLAASLKGEARDD